MPPALCAQGGTGRQQAPLQDSHGPVAFPFSAPPTSDRTLQPCLRPAQQRQSERQQAKLQQKAARPGCRWDGASKPAPVMRDMMWESGVVGRVASNLMAIHRHAASSACATKSSRARAACSWLLYCRQTRL